MDSDGDFVITWESYYQDGSETGIYAQRFKNDGSKDGDEFQVNTYTSDYQSKPSISMDSDGDFVITWQSNGQDGDYHGIYAQRYNNDGSKNGEEFQVNTYTSEEQMNPSTAMDSDGDFIVTWDSSNQDGDSTGIFAQKYDSSGNPVDSEFQVNTYVTSDQFFSSVAMDGDGDFVIAWQSDGQDGSSYGVFAKLYKINPTPTPTPTLTEIQTMTETPTPTDSGTPTLTATQTATDTGEVTQTPTLTQTPTYTGEVTQTPTLTQTATETSTITKTPTITSTPTITKTSTPTLTVTPMTSWYDIKPELLEGQVVPDTGFQNDSFEYLVHYSDPDGGYVPVKRLYINGQIKIMKLKTGNPYDGWYNFIINGNELNIGNNVFYFIFTDNEGNIVRYPKSGSLQGPWVDVRITITATQTITPTPTETPSIIPTQTKTPSLTQTPTSTPLATPAIISVESDYSGTFISSIPLKNEYRVGVQWNGPVGEVIFDVNGTQYNVQGTSSGASNTFDMSKDFKQSFFDIGNTLKITARHDGVESSPYILHPIVLPIPPWSLNLGYFSIDNDSEGLTYVLNFKFPDPQFSAEAKDIPSWIPFLGGSGLGITDTQATVKVVYNSKTKNGYIYITGKTGFAAAKNQINGKVTGEGNVQYVSGKGLNWERASFTLDIEGVISEEIGILELIPPLAMYSNVTGMKQINKSAKIVFEIRPKIWIALYFLDKPDDNVDKLVFDKFQGKLSYGATLGLKINLKVIEFGVYAYADIFIDVEAPHGDKSFGVNNLGISISGKAVIRVLFKKYEVPAGPYVYQISPGLKGIEYLGDKPKTYSIEDTVRADFLKFGPYSEFVGNAGIKEALNSKEQSSNQIEIISNVYEDSEPVMTEKDGNSIILWIYAEPPSSKNQNDEIRNTNIYFTEYDGSTFTTPAPIFNDEKAEFNPQVACDGNGNFVAVWERFKDTDFDSTDIQNMASKEEIVYSVYSKETKTWTTPIAITDNNYLDHLPKLKRNVNGNLFLLWESNTGNELISTQESPTILYYTVWDGTSWSEVKAGPYKFKDAFDFDVTCFQDKSIIFWTQDQDGDQNTVNDQEIFGCFFYSTSWDNPFRVTNDNLTDSHPQFLIDGKGKIQLFWLHDSKIVRLTDIKTMSFEVVRNDCGETGFMDYQLTSDKDGNLVIFWQGQNDKGSEINYIVYDEAHDSWSEDMNLTYGEKGEIVKNFQPLFNSSGEIMMVYNKETIEYEDVEYDINGRKVTLKEAAPGKNDLYLLTYGLSNDLTFSPDGLILSDENASPGTEITIKATAENTGDSGLDNVEVAFYDGDPKASGVLVDRKVIPGTLKAGSTYEVSINWTVPIDEFTHSIFAVIDPGNKIDEKNENNNTISNSFLLPDLEITGLNSEWKDDKNIELTATVMNNGKGSANNIKVEFRKDSAVGELIGSIEIPTLNPKASEDVTLSWNCDWEQKFNENQGIVYVSVDPDNSIKEAKEINNDAYLEINAHGKAEIPEVHIYSNETTYFNGDTIEIGIFVYNPTNENIDMYSAIPLGGSLYWYSIWDTTPHSTLIEPGTWEQKIVQLPADLIPSGSYTFYAAITEHETVNVLGLDSVTIRVQ